MKTGLTILALLAAAPLAAQTVTPAIKAALADPGRPAADKARDARSHPGEILAFAGIKPGMKVADFMMGAGYWTHILSPLVGPKGHVYGYQSSEFVKLRPAYGEEQKAAVAAHGNASAVTTPWQEVAFPEPLDAIITVQNYHDLHLNLSPADNATVTTKRLYEALKPGGLFLVIDHAANSDPGFKAPNSLHRIDPGAARTEIESVGFRYVGSSRLLANPADPKDKLVFDPGIRGKTDQFIFLFRKPK
ncbi:MAG: class I SAM-dependent methyltransferase [Sphingobium sp.]|nr:class I SAM-dependent methyltransferase [Sphingobium sp.]